jgi:hypothetical protein
MFEALHLAATIAQLSREPKAAAIHREDHARWHAERDRFEALSARQRAAEAA